MKAEDEKRIRLNLEKLSKDLLRVRAEKLDAALVYNGIVKQEQEIDRAINSSLKILNQNNMIV